MQLTLVAGSFAGLMNGALSTLAEQVGGFDDGHDFLDLFEDLMTAEPADQADADRFNNAYEAVRKLYNDALAADRAVNLVKTALQKGAIVLDQTDPTLVPAAVEAAELAEKHVVTERHINGADIQSEYVGSLTVRPISLDELRQVFGGDASDLRKAA